MSAFKIGVIIDSLRLPINEGLAKARALGADGIQVTTVDGAMAPENLNAHSRQTFLDQCQANHLTISALCGDLGGHGFQLEEENHIKIPRSKAIVDLASDWKVSVVTTHIGVIPQTNPALRSVMLSACRELGHYAADRGVTFAIETGPEPATVLRDFLVEVDSRGIGVNLDPANLIMVCNDDPVNAVRTLSQYIVHTHAKDGIQHQPCDPVQVYNAFADGGFDALVARTGNLFTETPLGAGGVNWKAYLQALTDCGFTGFLTIEREVGDNPEADIAAAIQFLQERI